MRTRHKQHVIRARHTRGISLIEALIGLGILVTVLVGLVVSFQVFFRVSLTNTEKIQGAFLLEEGIEIVRFLRDESWSTHIATVTVNTDYYPTFSGSTWTLTTTPTTTNSFTRKVTLHDVFRRDSDSVIVASTSPDTKTLDVNTKFVTVMVITPRAAEMELSTYITNLFAN